MTRRYERYVAIGDSTTEGLEDPDGQGGYRGWADRLAERVALHQGSLLYANLAVRGKYTRQILAEQLEPALALKPDLVTVVVGMNDLVQPRFELEPLIADLDELQRAFAAINATVVTFTLPDLSSIMPIARLIVRRTRALNEALRAAAARNGAVLADIAANPLTSDPRLWASDRLHANTDGHTRIAGALADALGIPTDGMWNAPMSERPKPTLAERLAIEGRWARDHMLPWAVRGLRGTSMGDGRSGKRPVLLPVSVP